MNKKSSPRSILFLSAHQLLAGHALTQKWQMLRYFIVAGVATVADYLLNVLCYTALDLFSLVNPSTNTALSVSLGFAFGVWVNYVLSIKWAFSSSTQGHSWKDRGIFLLTALMGLGINIAIVQLLLYYLALDPRIGRIPAILIAFLWNYYSKKWWVFKS